MISYSYNYDGFILLNFFIFETDDLLISYCAVRLDKDINCCDLKLIFLSFAYLKTFLSQK